MPGCDFVAIDQAMAQRIDRIGVAVPALSILLSKSDWDARFIDRQNNDLSAVNGRDRTVKLCRESELCILCEFS